MNIGAHIAVARSLQLRRGGPQQHTDPLELLGSALPDLASMGRFRIGRRSPNASLDAGIHLHHRTDDLFHALHWFARRQSALTAELTELGFERGPAMACSHVGIELMIDGELLADPFVAEANEAAFAAIDSEGEALGAVVGVGERSSWLHHLGRFSGQPPLRNLHDPTEVAARLFRILAPRPRLAFDRGQLPVLEAVLDRHRPAAALAGHAVVAQLVDRLAAELPVTTVASGAHARSNPAPTAQL